jgi:hypothetical protein
MNARISALLGALALGAVALTGCSAATGGAADLAGARQPLLKANAEASASTAGQVAATAISADDFRQAQHCLPSGQLKVCQLLETSGSGSAARVSWTVWVAFPDASAHNVKLEIAGGGVYAFDYVANVEATSQYVELDWQSPGIPSLTQLQTDVTVGLEDGSYLTDCFPEYMGHGDYDMEECTLPTLTD